MESGESLSDLAGRPQEHLRELRYQVHTVVFESQVPVIVALRGWLSLDQTLERIDQPQDRFELSDNLPLEQLVGLDTCC